MKYNLKTYQRNAVDEIKAKMESFLNSGYNGKIVFKSPTGSGKTFMMSSLFEEIANEYDDLRFCVIWCCPGKGDLHKQSYNNVKDYLEGYPVCSLLEEEFFGSRDSINNKEIVFVNWEKLINKDKETGEWKNNLMKDQEGANFLNVLENTRNNGLKIILIVDESHIGRSLKARIREFQDEIIKSNFTINMSATPIYDSVDVKVKAQDVIDEGMIKENIIVNEGITKEDRSLEEKDSEALVLEKGFDKRLELKKRYEELGSNVNPLVLVQIPNTEAGEDKKLVTKDFLRERGVNEENGKLKLWCDGEASFDKKEIRKNDDETEFLIFKTAVATGWDCPRAHVLIKFRDGYSETFEIQTIGRILRTAEAKSYDDELLDNAYIFTNIKDFETRQGSYNPNRIKTETSYFREPYTKERFWNETKLKSFYKSRSGNYNAADSNFVPFYEKCFMEFFELTKDDANKPWTNNNDKFEMKNCNMSGLVNHLITEETNVNSADVDIEGSIRTDNVKVKLSENDIVASYYDLISNNLNSLARVRSLKPINTAIVSTFDKFYTGAFPRSEKIKAYQKIVVNNNSIFNRILSQATLEFCDYLSRRTKNEGEFYDFKIEDKRSYSIETHVKLDIRKSLYQPLYVLRDKDTHEVNNLEKDFLKYIDEEEMVDWVWENGPEHMRVNFGVPYHNKQNTFRPDFIIRFKDGTIGIYDTKATKDRISEVKEKAKGLYNYLREVNHNKGHARDVLGGIIVKASNGRFYVYNRSEYHPIVESLEGWEDFDDTLRKIRVNYEVKQYNKNKMN